MPATRRFVAIASVAVLIVMCAGLWIERRIWHCTCGSWAIWISDVNSRHCSQHLLDAYSFTHFLHGFVFFAGLWYLRDRWTASQRFLACLALEAAWELFENTPFVIDRYRAATMALGYEGDSIVNSIGDLLACGLGCGVAQRLPWKLSVALFLLVEAALVVMIRDSLALNIVMLLWPLDVLKQWQMGAGGL